MEEVDMVLVREEVEEEVLQYIKDTFMIEGVEQDRYIKRLTSNVLKKFRARTGTDLVYEDVLYVIEEVVEKNYVRRGSRGITSENRDGYSLSYKDSEDDFAEYAEDLAVYYDKVEERLRPTMRFL